MSYDVYLTVDVGGEHRAIIDVLDHWNYTSNVAPMWRKAMPETDGLAGFDDMAAGDVVPILEVGIERMEANRASFVEMNPPNGWGDYEGQLEALKRLLVACRAAPRAVVEVSR